MKQGRKLSIKENNSYFLTTTVIEWFRVFESPELSDIIVDSLRHCIRHKGLNIYAYVIMPSHLHMVVNCDEPFQLRDTIRDFKRHTSTTCFDWMQNNSDKFDSRIINEMIKRGEADPKNKKTKFWQSGNHAIELYTPKFTWRKIVYIHKNPVRAGLVEKIEDWKYSSARNYMDMESILPEVIVLTPPLF